MAISLRSDASGTFGAIALDGVDRIKVDTSGNVTFLGQTIYSGGFNSTPLGQTTPAAGTFTTLTSTGNTTIGDALADTLTINATINGAVKLEESLLDTTTTAFSTTTQAAVYTYTASAYRTGKFVVQVVDATNSQYHSVEIMLIHNGTTVNQITYGSVHTASELGAFDANISGGNVQLLFTPVGATNKTVKVIATLVTA